MKLLAISDVHSSKTSLSSLRRESFDAVLLAGDISNGSMSDVKEVLKFLRDLGSPVFFVPGNMDPKSLLDVHELEGCLNIHGDKSYLGRYSIGGVGGGTISPFSTRIEFSEEEIGSLLKELGRVDVILTHTPPFGTKLDRVRSGISVGSRALRKYIEEYSPLLCVCGHIHESSGVERIGDTLAVNPGSLSWGMYALIELNEDRVIAHLKSLCTSSNL
ncbi:MAG: metallophosphoesterase family protein [Candidatus Korarchaeum sp.]|nr:metallophosphoesterase family protein [Candidatus Korarchaeum sp.]MDW8034958.1 metallophosphoesterase family protein [Candidatus Korarchaeum sp.]